MVLNLTELINEVISNQRTKAEKKGLWLRFEKEPSLPVMVRSDEDKLRRVLTILLDNAIQYTDSGGVTLSVNKRGQEAEFSPGSDSIGYLPSTVHLAFTVQDTGPGIDPNMIEQLTTSRSRRSIEALRKSDAGIGIPIAVTLVELMGGKLSMSSTLDKGTDVVVELVLEIADVLDWKVETPYVVSPVQPGQRKPSIFSSDHLAGMVILFFVSALLFVWPFLAAPSMQQSHVLFVYLFTAWAVVIILIFLLNRGHPSAGLRQKEKYRET
jgi:hypothetical protein